MAYFKKVLQRDENIKYRGKLHWIIYRSSILFAALAVIPAAYSNGEAAPRLLFASLLVLIALATFMGAWFRRVTTEIVITDKRIIYKRGWIARHTEEMNITKVETIDVDQTILGRLLGYGTVLIHGVGSSWEPLRRIASPLELRNAIIVG